LYGSCGNNGSSKFQLVKYCMRTGKVVFTDKYLLHHFHNELHFENMIYMIHMS